MKLPSLFEAVFKYKFREIDRNDTEGLYEFCDFYNESGELSWTLSPERLLSKIGSTGKVYGLYTTIHGEDVLVGTIGIKKSAQIDDAVELGYIMIDKLHRSFKNLMLMYKGIKNDLRRYDIVYATTNKDNNTINTILAATNKFKKVLLIRSPYSSNKLFVWIYVDGKSEEEISQIRKEIDIGFRTHVLSIVDED